MSKRNLLKKIAKGASVALLAGGMVCGASLTNVNAKSVKSNKDAKVEKAMTKKGLLGNARKGVKNNKKSAKKNKKNVRKNIKHAKKAASKKSNKKASKKSAKKGSKLAKKASKKSSKKASSKKAASKKLAKRANKKAGSKKAAKRAEKKAAAKKLAKRAKALRRAKAAKKAARRSLRRHAVKPMNNRAYRAHVRAVKHFRHSRYYHNVWSSAEKINKRAVRLDQARLNKTNKANNSKHLTKYEHRALKSSIKAQKRHINYMMGYVNHDAHMLNLAK